MEFSAEMIAGALGGEIIGDKNVIVRSLGKIEEATTGDIAFLANPKYEHFIYDSNASIIIVNRTFTPSQTVKATMIKVDDAYSCFAKLLNMYVANKPQKKGISPQASVAEGVEVDQDSYIGEFTVISPGVKLGKNVKIYPQVYLGDNVKVGDNTTIYPGVKIYENCVIGSRVIIHAGVIIGADGFGFAPVDGNYNKIPQIGNVVIEDDVELGANTCIDRATMGSTTIKRGVKLDNLIQIGHNVTIGENTVMAAQCGVAGSSKIGRHCMFGGQVGVMGHLNIVDNTTVAAKTGVTNNIKTEGQTLMGHPFMSSSKFRRSHIIFRNLPELDARVLRIEKKIEGDK